MSVPTWFLVTIWLLAVTWCLALVYIARHYGGPFVLPFLSVPAFGIAIFATSRHERSTPGTREHGT